MNIKIISIISLFLLSSVGCSSSEFMVSSSVNNITIDGNHEDWSGKLKYYEDEKVAIGFQNDDKNLYFCLVTSYRANAMKIMAFGLTVWFEPENGEQEIGLQYPKRIDGAHTRSLMGMNRNNEQNSNFEAIVNSMMQYQGEYFLIDEDEEIFYAAPLRSSDGFDLKLNAVNQQFVYEAKIPIGNNSLAQFPISIFPNENATIRFETGEIDLDEMKRNSGMQQQGMGKGGSGMQGGVQGGRGSMQSGGRSGKSRMGMERLYFDVEVKLSK